MESPVKELMQKPYPIVSFSDSIDSISKRINESNNACLFMDMGGNWHIITKQDIIQALAHV